MSIIDEVVSGAKALITLADTLKNARLKQQITEHATKALQLQMQHAELQNEIQ